MQEPPIILAIDTSLGRGSVAILKGNKIMVNLHEEEAGQQSRTLLPMLESALEQANIDYAGCDAVACTIGPGGFTGIRVGLTAARTITLVTGKILIGLTTLEVIAFSAGIKGDIVAAIDAYRSQWYVQRFRMNGELVPLSDPLLADEKGKKALSHGAKIIETPPDAAQVALLAYDKWMRGEREFPATPLYIREPDAKLPAHHA